MQQVTVLLQNQIKSITNSLAFAQRECKSIYDAYWKTDANTQISGLSDDDDPATVDSNLTKKNYIDGITFIESLNNFFQGSAVTQKDYMQTCNQIQYGNADLATSLSEATEQIGSRILQLVLDVIQIHKDMLDVVDIYFDEEIGDTVAVLDGERIIYGSEMTRNDLANVIILFQQFDNMLINTSVTTGDYSATISRWKKYETI